MTHAQEWALTRDGDVILSLDERLESAPVRAAVTNRGLLLVATADGRSHSFVPANQKVSGALRRSDDVVITEPPRGDMDRRTTTLATKAVAIEPGMRA